MILDLPPQTAHIISTIAEQQGQTLENFMIISAYEKALQLAYAPQQAIVLQLSQTDKENINKALEQSPNKAMLDLLKLTDNITDLT